MAAIARHTFLSGVIANPRAGLIRENNRFRRYRTSVRTTSTIGGVEDSRNVPIYYEVGRGVPTVAQGLATAGVAHVGVEAGYATNSIVAEDFIGFAKKYSNFSASFEYSSLAGVAERLARGLACASVFEGVTSTDLRGNNALVINALGTYDGPVNSLTNTVFIPRLVNNNIGGDVFSVLANAIAGEGSSVATDVVELDATTRAPIVPEVDEFGLATACVDALRIVGANMIASDQGPLFALAVTRGIHRILSVVGHTDEGAITRDLLRCGYFATPFGGIHYGLEPYAGLPALHTNGRAHVAAYVDAIALTSAGAVAHADPGVTFNGEWFPTFFNGTGTDDAIVRPGQHTDGTPAHSGRNRSQLLAMVASFWEPYINALGWIFCAEGQASTAVRFATAASHSLAADPRHLRYASVAPFFWVEPTSLLPHDFLGTAAESAGTASLGWKDVTRTKPAWEGLALAGEKDTTFSAYVAKFRSPRQSWFFNHWLGHPLNGLGAIRVRQLDPNGIIHPGANAAHPDVRDRVEADLPFTDYMWVRGQSPFPAPGEMMNLALSVGFLVRHLTYGDDGLPVEEHLPTSREFLDCCVTIHVGRPLGVGIGASNSPDATTRRARTRATNELAAARRRAALFGRADIAEMPTLSTAPALSGRLGLSDTTEGGSTGGGQRGRATALSVGIGGAGVREPTGEPRPAVPQYMPVRYPQLARQGGGGLGGGALPPAPPPAPPGPPTDDDHAPAQPIAPAPPVGPPPAAAPAERAGPA